MGPSSRQTKEGQTDTVLADHTEQGGDLLQEGQQGCYKDVAYHHKGYLYNYYPATIQDWNPLLTETKDSKSLEIIKSRLPTMSY